MSRIWVLTAWNKQINNNVAARSLCLSAATHSFIRFGWNDPLSRSSVYLESKCFSVSVSRLAADSHRVWRSRPALYKMIKSSSLVFRCFLWNLSVQLKCVKVLLSHTHTHTHTHNGLYVSVCLSLRAASGFVGHFVRSDLVPPTWPTLSLFIWSVMSATNRTVNSLISRVHQLSMNWW